jgi:hypothetical protein
LENSLGFSNNGVITMVIDTFHLFMRLRYIFIDHKLPSKSYEEDYFKLNRKEIKEDKEFKDNSKVEISSQPEHEILKRNTISLLFKESIGLDKILESKILELDIEGMRNIPL